MDRTEPKIQEELLNILKRSVIDGDSVACTDAAKSWLESQTEPIVAVEQGLTPGIREVGRLYEEGEYFLPELITSAEAMKSALKILQPAFAQNAEKKDSGMVIMATVEGDIHEIGKSIVSAILEARGFQVFDLGPNVKLEFLYEKVKEIDPDVVGLSALLTTTMINQKRAIAEFKKRGIRAKVIVGGAPVSPEWARQIGAHGYAKDAFKAGELVQSLINRK